LYYTAILGVILVCYTGILYFGQYYALYRDLDSELAIKAQEVASAINSFLPVLEDDQRAFRFSANMVIRQEVMYLNQEKITEAKKRWLAMREKLNIHNDYVVLASTDGEVIANSQNVDTQLLPYLLKTSAIAAQKSVSYRDFNFGTERLRLITIPYYYKNKRMYLLQVGTSLTPIIEVLYGRMLFAFFAIPLVLLFASFLGGVITERILRPVLEVTNIAKNITYKGLSSRVKVEQVDEELRYLVDAFNEMISRLDNSFRYIDEFSSNVAHELKTPLTIISGESDLALMQERDVQEYKRVIGVNLREAGHMLKIVDDLLLLSRLEYQPEVFKFEQIDFSVFITEIFEQAKKLASSKNISVSLDLPDTRITILADWLHLRRLFINLLNNAVKFTPADGSITIAVKPREKELLVSVSDTGIGIAPEHISKLFDRFFHIDRGSTADKDSSGLGLSIAQSIVRIHRGNISVESHPQKGSSFTVTLPI
jgi:heavy metal sensor kinase